MPGAGVQPEQKQAQAMQDSGHGAGGQGTLTPSGLGKPGSLLLPAMLPSPCLKK